MEPSQKQRTPSNLSHRFSEQSVQEPESYCLPTIPNSDPNSSSEDSSHGTQPSSRYFELYCTLESSSGTSSNFVQNSLSPVSVTPNGSPVSQLDSKSFPVDPHQSPNYTCNSPVSGSCLTDDVDDLRHKIRELETAMLGTDSDSLDVHSITTTVGHNQYKVPSEAEKWKQIMEMVAGRNLKDVLCSCAKAIADNDIPTADWLVTELRQMVSVSGEPIQRLGAYLLEGFIARFASSGSSIYKALRCKEPASPELLSYMSLLYEVCPYFKFGYMSANGAIAEALKDESEVHIIDFQIGQGSQWITLIQGLAGRPGGPPRIRITGIDDSFSAYARGGGLDIVGKRLSKLAQSCNVPFEFNASAISAAEVQLQDLRVRPGEAIAVNFAFVLHHMPDESVGSQNHRDRLLRLIKRLSPKVVTLVEQESNTNTAPFFHRFLETLDYYLAIFESIDVTLPREHKERINVEQHCLARDIVNLIACEGIERVERHEVLGKWKSRFMMAGFTPYPLSSLVNATIKTLLQNYCEKYTLEERDGALFLGWLNRVLVASSAWR